MAQSPSSSSDPYAGIGQADPYAEIGGDPYAIISDPYTVTPEQRQAATAVAAKIRQLREEQDAADAAPRYRIGLQLPFMDAPLVSAPIPAELAAFGSEAAKGVAPTGAGLRAASLVTPYSTATANVLRATPGAGRVLAPLVQYGAPLIAGGAAALVTRRAEDEILPAVLPDAAARSYELGTQLAAESPTAAMLGQFAGAGPFFRPGLPLNSAGGARLLTPSVAGGIGGGIEGAQQLASGEFDPQRLALATAGSALLNRETALGARVGPNLVLPNVAGGVPDELATVGRTLREPVLPEATDALPTELGTVAGARGSVTAEQNAAAEAAAAAASARRIYELAERMAGVTLPEQKLQILDQELRLQKDYLTPAEQRGGLDLKLELQRQIDAQNALQEGVEAQQKAAQDAQKAIAEQQKAIEAAQQPPELPKSAQILAEPVTKTPSIANVATEVATQTENSPYALQEQLNKMTTPAAAQVAGGVPPAIASLNAADFRNWAAQQPGGITTSAYDAGLAAIGNTAKIEELKASRALAEAESQAANDRIKTGDMDAFDDASSLATKVQYFREAIEAAEGKGSAMTDPRVKAAHGRQAQKPESPLSPPTIPNIASASGDEIDDWLASVRRFEKDIDVAILGEDLAKEHRRLTRTANSSQYSANDPRVKAADARIAEIEGALTPEQQDIFYGVKLPEGFLGEEQAQAISRAVNDIDSARNAAELARQNSKLIQKFLRAASGQEALGPIDSALAARLSNQAREIGATPQQIVEQYFKYRSQFEGDDVFELAGTTPEQLLRFLSPSQQGEPNRALPQQIPNALPLRGTPEAGAGIRPANDANQAASRASQAENVARAQAAEEPRVEPLPLSRTYYRGQPRAGAPVGEDLFYSSSRDVAENYAGQRGAGDEGRITKHKPVEFPKKLYQAVDKESLAEELGIAIPHYDFAFDAAARAILKERGFEGIRYTNGTFDADEVHVFGKPKTEASPTPRTAEQRLNDAGLGLPPISGMSQAAKRAELQAAGVTTYAGKPIEDINPAQLSNAVGRLRRGQLGDTRGSVPSQAIAPLGGAAGGGVAGAASQTQREGESDEEFQARRIRAGLAGAVLGSGGATATTSLFRNLTNKQASAARALKALQEEATGREAMPAWYLKARQSPTGVKIREAINNSRVRVKDIVANVAKDVALPDAQNPYLAGKLYPGRSSERVRQAEVAMRGVQDRVVDAAKAAGVPVDDFVKRFDLWLEARHTPYYNEALRERYKDSGEPAPQHRFTDQQAAEILAETGKDGYGKVFSELAKEQENIIEQTRDLLVKGGIIDQQTADGWRKAYPNYVPFNRIMPEDALEGAVEKFVGGGPGMNVLGTGVYKIKGSDLPVADISGSIYGNFIDAIRRTEKNRVDQAALNFFQGPGKSVPGVTYRKPKFGENFDPNTMLAVRKNGERYWIEFKDPKLATAFSNLNSENASGLLKLISYPTRWFSGLVTRFNPNFLAANPIRDRQEAALKLASQGDWSGAVQQLNPVTVAYKDPKTVVDWVRGANSPDAQLFQQMLDDGGMAGGFASMTKQKAADAVKEFRTSDVNPIVGAKDKFIKFVDFLTDVSEGSTRFRAYKRALENGATRDEAALAARNVSIDFNQKGTVTPQAAALWSFFNPAVQGPINSTKALIRNPETLATIAATFVGVGAAVDAWNSSFDPDWKKKRSFQFSRTTGIPVIYGTDEKTGETLTFNFPVAHSLRPIKAAIDFMSDAAGGEIDPANMDQELARVGGAVIDSTNPLGSGSFKTALSPTIGRPALEVWLNEKFTGSPVVPKWMEADPMIADRAKRYLSSYDTKTGQMANSLVDTLHETTGADISPERMRYLVRQYSGGPGRAIADLINTSPKIIKAMEGSPDFGEIRASESPVASAFFRRINPEISERESPEYRATEEYVREVKTDEELRRQQARLFYRDNVEAIPPENRVAFIQAADAAGYIPPDPAYRGTLLNLLRDGLKGRDETDTLIGSLGVETGERARYYADRLTRMATDEERMQFLTEQAQRGLLNGVVQQQLQALAQQPAEAN